MCLIWTLSLGQLISETEHLCPLYIKVQIFWEGQNKQIEKISQLFWTYEVTSNTIGRFFQKILAFSKYLDFSDQRLYFLEIICKQEKGMKILEYVILVCIL